MWQAILDSAGVGAVMIDETGCIKFINRYLATALGIDRQQWVGQAVDVLFPHCPRWWFNRYCPGESVRLKAHGRSWLITCHVLENKGQYAGMLLWCQDVSEIELMTEALKAEKQARDELEAIFDASIDEIYVVDSQGITLKVNRVAESYYGVPASQLIGRSVFELKKEGFFSPSSVELVLKEKKRVTIVQRTRTGKTLLTTANPVFDNEGNITKIVVNARDISELLNLRQKLEDTERLAERYRQRLLSLQQGQLSLPQIIARSSQMQNLMQVIERVAAVDSTVLITGESGVGKGLVASRIHALSPRSRGPFVAINCGAIPPTLLESELFGYIEGAFTGARRGGKKGLIQLAHGGTVFLDEITELPVAMQVKLLQVIQEKRLLPVGGERHLPVDVRFIAATNRDLREAVAAGLLREDLYYRLNVIPLHVPPLRQRPEDIPPLLEYFLERFNLRYDTRKRFHPEVIEILIRYNWPGNVREVENLVERLAVTVEGDEIAVHHLPEYILHNSSAAARQRVVVTDIVPLKDAIEELEGKLIVRAYEKYRNTYKVAEVLGINQSTVVRKLKKYAPGMSKRYDKK